MISEITGKMTGIDGAISPNDPLLKLFKGLARAQFTPEQTAYLGGKFDENGLRFRVPSIEEKQPGLDSVVNIILKRDKPLLNVFREFGSLLFTEEHAEMLNNLLSDSKTSESTRHLLRLGYYSGDCVPFQFRARDFLATGVDYARMPESERMIAFPKGDQRVYLLNRANAQFDQHFAISLFPEESTGIDEKGKMIGRYKNPVFARDDEQVKTLLLYNAHLGQFYLAVVPGNDKVNIKGIAEILDLRKSGLSKKQADIVVASKTPQEIIGRESGAVSPLIHVQYFRNVQNVFVAEQLLTPYSKPHYAMVVDRRSALVVSDVQKLMDILGGINGFPEIKTYNNKSNS
ncbi:hypothetical protein J4212_06710 [Candidatus Woesearchaeota archaeon]|nr:hypothetical protein [Candidatus Woesearchaeota archaeon]